MKDENYYVVKGWMITKLKLKGNEKDLFAIIHGYSQDGVSKCKSSITYIMEALSCSRNTAIKTRRALIKKKLVKEHKKKSGNEYSSNIELVQKLVVQKLNPCSSKTELLSSSKTEPNKYNINTNKDNIVEASSTEKKDDSKEPMNLQEFIKSMKEPKSGKPPRYPVVIIAEWADTIRPNLKTKGQWKEFLKRNLRPANSLKHFSLEDIEKAYKKAKYDSDNSNGFSVTLETILKYLTK